MTKDVADIVSALRAALAAKVGKERYELWFGPRTRIEWDNQTLQIAAPSAFFLDWIRLNFRTVIEDVGRSVLHHTPELQFVVAQTVNENGKQMNEATVPIFVPQKWDCLPLPHAQGEANGALCAGVQDNRGNSHAVCADKTTETAARPQGDCPDFCGDHFAVPAAAGVARTPQSGRPWSACGSAVAKNGTAYPSAALAAAPVGAQADTMVSLASHGKRDRETAAAMAMRPAEAVAPAAAYAPRKFASLSSFVGGPCNKLALYSAEMVVRNPGQITPLFIHGPTSVGKTHLLEGIWSAERKAGHGTTCVYLSAEQFTSQFLEALRGGGLPVFRSKYRGVRVLLLDDLHFLAGKRATQVEMMHTVDTLLREGRQLVAAADRPPADFSDFMPELITRLSSGMVCRVEPPEFSTRLGIVATISRRLGVELPPEVQRYVATQFTAHAREISGAICRLQATSQATRRKITLDLAEEALGEMIRQNSRVVRLGDIGKAVCKVFGLQQQTLQSADKSRRVSQPRMLAMWLARKHTRAALSEIGEFFGRRSHSTVISAQKRIDQWMAEDEPLSFPERTWKIDEAIRQVERQLIAG